MSSGLGVVPFLQNAAAASAKLRNGSSWLEYVEHSDCQLEYAFRSFFLQ